MPQTIHTHEAGQGWVVARRTFEVLLFLVANLLAGCGGGGGGVDAATSTPGLPAASLTCVGTSTAGSSATLTWDAVTTGDVSGYRIYYGTVPGSYEQLPGQGIEVGDCTTYTVTGLGSGTVYYFAVTAYHVTEESGYSNEVSKQMP